MYWPSCDGLLLEDGAAPEDVDGSIWWCFLDFSSPRAGGMNLGVARLPLATILGMDGDVEGSTNLEKALKTELATPLAADEDEVDDQGCWWCWYTEDLDDESSMVFDGRYFLSDSINIGYEEDEVFSFSSWWWCWCWCCCWDERETDWKLRSIFSYDRSESVSSSSLFFMGLLLDCSSREMPWTSSWCCIKHLW